MSALTSPAPKPGDHPAGPTLRAGDHLYQQLCKMYQGYSIMSLIINAAKAKGVGLDKVDVLHGQPISGNPYVMVFRGRAAELVNSVLDREETGLAAQQIRDTIRRDIGEGKSIHPVQAEAAAIAGQPQKGGSKV